MIGWTLCSGIGAPEVAAPWIDWRLASEIEPFPRSMLQARFGYRAAGERSPGEPLLWGDMTQVDAALASREAVPLPDIIAAGTPCQSFSVAGARKGLADERGNLTLHFVRIIHDIVSARPDGSLTVLWENVPGVLSDTTNAFGAFLGGLVGADAPLVPSPPPRAAGSGKGHWRRLPRRRWRDKGRRRYRKPRWACTWPSAGMVAGPRARVAWRVLDAQHFGVPQRRRRVFLVADFGGRADPAKILFERKGGGGDSAARGGTGQTAPTLPSRSTGGGGLGTDFDLDGGLIASSTGDVAHCLNAGGMGRIDYESETMIAHTLRGEGFDASEDGTGRGTPLVPVAFSSKDFGGDAMEDLSPTLRAGGHSDSHPNAGIPPAVAYAIRSDADRSGVAIAPSRDAAGKKRLRNPGLGITEGVAPTLDASRPHAVAYAIQERAVAEGVNSGPGGKGVRDDDKAYTLEARHHVQAVAFDLRGRDGGAMPEGPHDTANIRAASGGSSRSYIATQWAVRRLTPTECHRLQGFPDDHCAVVHRGKPAADGPQYKALGNSWAVPVAEWIMDRIRSELEAA